MNILLYVCYVILIGFILKLFDGKQTNNDKIIKIIIIIGIGLFIIMLLMPNKNMEKFGCPRDPITYQYTVIPGTQDLGTVCTSPCDCKSSFCDYDKGKKKGKCRLYHYN